MRIIGCDFHPSWQQVRWLDTETGEVGESKAGSPAENSPRSCPDRSRRDR
jgi:hypothetical protein